MVRPRTKKFDKNKRDKFYITDNLDFNFYKILDKENGIYYSYIAKAKDQIGEFYINYDGSVWDGKIDMIINIW